MFHFPTCANITEVGWNRLGPDRQAVWKCPSCKVQTLSTPQIEISDKETSPVDQLNPLNTVALAMVNDKLTSKDSNKTFTVDQKTTPGSEIRELTSEVRRLANEISSLKNKLEDATTSLSRCNERLDELGNSMAAADVRLKKLEERDARILELESTVSTLTYEANAQAQYQHRNEIEICGIPENKNENLHHIMLVAARKIGINLDDQDIDWVARVGPREPAHKKNDLKFTRPIVMRLTRRAKRDQMMKASKSRKNLTSTDLDVDGTTRDVFFNERLTKANRMLFRETKIRAKNKGYTYCWCSQGAILIRMREGTSAIQIRSEEELVRILGTGNDITTKCSVSPSTDALV